MNWISKLFKAEDVRKTCTRSTSTSVFFSRCLHLEERLNEYFRYSQSGTRWRCRDVGIRGRVNISEFSNHGGLEI
jgi:hypothetical protein